MAQPEPFRKRPPPPASPEPPDERPGRFRFVAMIVAILGILCLGWHLGAQMIGQTNRNLGPVTDPATGKVRGDQDQKHNINQALRDMQRRQGKLPPPIASGPALTAWIPHVTDGVVAPLWPRIASYLADPDHYLDPGYATDSDRVLFERGKWANLAMVTAFLGILGLALARRWRPPAVVCVLLLAAFGALIPRAVYFQPEPVFYMLFFVAWVCALRLMVSNPLWLHAVFGLAAGLAYLAKTSVEPLVLSWLALTALRFVREVRRKDDDAGDDRWSAFRAVAGVGMFAICWAIVVVPRYSFASAQWGDARHTYPAYWMWFDKFEDGYRWMADHPDRKSLEAVAPADLPSFAAYRSTHTPDEMLTRLKDGVQEKVSGFLAPKRVKVSKSKPFPGWKHLLEQRGLYLGAAGGMALLAGALALARRSRRDEPGGALPSGSLESFLFVAGTAAGFTLLYGWYSPIGRGDRFMLSLYLPVAFSLVWAAESLLRLAEARGAGRLSVLVYSTAFWVLNAAIAWRLVEVLRLPEFDPGTT